jgi:hypothetical protein
MLARLKFDIPEVVNKILDKIPQELIINGTVLDPAIAGGQFVKEIERRKRAAGKTDAEIAATVFGIEENVLRRDYAVNKHRLVGTYTVDKFLTTDMKMKFDVIIGNPPYQDEASGNEKSNLYVEFSRNAITQCVNPGGIISFLTPKTLLRKTKRYFSLVGQEGLKSVDFSAGDYFDVGVDIVAWEVVNGVTFSDVEVTNIDGTVTSVPAGEEIADSEDMWMYNIISTIKNNPNKAFKYNNIGPTRSKTKTSEYSYELRQNIKKNSVVYSKREPYFYGKRKLLISVSKGYNKENLLIDTADYAEAYVCMDLTHVTDAQYDNILSFLYNDLFIKLVAKYRLIYKTGFANILVYLPVFDINVSHTDDSIKQFFNLTDENIEQLNA